MKRLILVVSLIVSTIGYSQIYDPNEPTEQQEEQAKEVVAKLDSELGLTAKQEVLVLKSYADFIVKENLMITSDRNLEDKNRLLKALYIEQAKELNDVLTKPQRERFKKIRGKYDPLIQLKSK